MIQHSDLPVRTFLRSKMSKLFKYASAVRRYHDYRKYLQPKESQSLGYLYEKDNPFFDFFAIKVMDQDTGTTDGHLPMESSCATKFLLNRGARVVSILTSTNYCVLPLVQGGLEITCRVEIYVSPTDKNKQSIDIYRNYVHLRYHERKISNTVGSFIVREEKTSSGSSKSSEGNAEKNTTKLTSCHKDIRSFVVVQPKTTGTKASQTNVIELSDRKTDWE